MSHPLRPADSRMSRSRADSIAFVIRLHPIRAGGPEIVPPPYAAMRIGHDDAGETAAQQRQCRLARNPFSELELDVTIRLRYLVLAALGLFAIQVAMIPIAVAFAPGRRGAGSALVARERLHLPGPH